MTNTSFYNHWAGRLLLLASLFCWPIHDWAQEITGDMRTRQEKRIKDRLQEFYDNCVVACMDRDYDFIEAIGKKHTLPGGAFKPDFGKFNEDGLWSFRNYCDNFIGLYGSIFEDGEMMEFRQSDIHFLSLKMVDGGNNVEANFTYTNQLYAGEQLITSAQKVEALLVISMMDPSDYRFKQIVPNQPVTVHYSPEGKFLEEVATPRIEVPEVLEEQSNTTDGDMQYHKVRIGDTVSKIARKYGVTVKHLCELNDINSMTILRLGQLLRLSSKNEKTVLPVETPIIEVPDLKADGEMNGHEYVDLGLSVMWATCNLGASKPSDYGDYFAWGETKPKENYDLGDVNNVVLICDTPTLDIAGNIQYDAARANWGRGWWMPTFSEMKELKDRCQWRWDIQDGRKGYKVTGPSGKSIFLPAAGIRNKTSLIAPELIGSYWCATTEEDPISLYFNREKYIWECGGYWYGRSIRPVTNALKKQNSSVTSIVSAKEEIFTINGVNFTMVRVEGGKFQMGATSEQQRPEPDEKPAHQVTISDYLIGQTEVTQALWKAVMGTNPSCFKGDNLPVECVSWNDCQTFIHKLSILTGRTFRLPSEAEWEYAARGGNQSKGYQYAGSKRLRNVAWFDGNSDKHTHPIATKSANELGLYDMSGNVREWCQDWKESYIGISQINPTGPSTGSIHVSRGGSWWDYINECRVAHRKGYGSFFRDSFLGFRLAL